MDAPYLLSQIDIWCQWDQTFEQQAHQLRQFFSAHPDTLQTLLLFLLESRGQQPTKKWLTRWKQHRSTLPDPLMRSWLQGLAGKKQWYARRATETECVTLQQHASGQTGNVRIYVIRGRTLQVRAPRANPAHAVGDFVSWHLEDLQWYQGLLDEDAELTANIGRGACWALADFPDQGVREQLTQLAIKHVRAAVWALATIGDDDAIARLNLVTTCTSDRQTLKKIHESLDLLANRRDMSREEMADQLVPTHDLDELAERVWHTEGYRVTLSLTPGGRIQRTIVSSDGKIRRTLPPGHEGLWQEVLTESQALSKTLSTQKNRLEEAMVVGRRWPVERWKAIFGSHPISGHLAHRLVWKIKDPDVPQALYVFPGRDEDWYTVNGEVREPSAQSRLSLAHPIEMPAEEHARWQHFIVTQQIVQPFKQMFRETYPLTPAEEAVRTYSTRFAGHVVPYQRATGLANHRGWSGKNNGHGVLLCWRDFPAIRAHLWCGSGLEGTVLQQIAFYPLDHPILLYHPDLTLDESCLMLREIDPIMFSEVMRDIDQYVVAASLGTDENWQDAGDRIPGIVRQHAEQAKMRIDLFRELLPLLDLANHVQLEGDCALIQGTRARYKVHLGNGSVYVTPDGRYLCIVPTSKTSSLYLPFEETDLKTMEILSKILLLIADDRITDPTILRQLPRSRGDQ